MEIRHISNIEKYVCISPINFLNTSYLFNENKSNNIGYIFKLQSYIKQSYKYKRTQTFIRAHSFYDWKNSNIQNFDIYYTY